MLYRFAHSVGKVFMHQMLTRTISRRAVAIAICAGTVAAAATSARAQSPLEAVNLPEPRTLTEAQSLFYNAHYEGAAAMALGLHLPGAEDLPIVELRSSALLFQIKALLEGRPTAKDDALKRCATCSALIADFLEEIHRGQSLARAALQDDPANDTALFFLGKLDLNYVWLQLGPLRRKTGWDEYWEARHSLDAVLKHDPRHVRARIARAWIDYIVDTKMPWGTRWLLGGGNRKQALIDVRAATDMDADFFTHAEAEFALWDMQVRERAMTPATEVARQLARDFPDNRELAAFLEAHSAGSR